MSVCISKCVDSVELRLNCLLQMWHWKILSPFCLETDGWWTPSSICEVESCGVMPWTRREWIGNKIWHHHWGWESANGIDGTTRISGKNSPPVMCYTHRPLWAQIGFANFRSEPNPNPKIRILCDQKTIYLHLIDWTDSTVSQLCLFQPNSKSTVLTKLWLNLIRLVQITW